MNVSPKLLSKVLANRLKKVMGYLVSDNQSAFIKNRQMSDCIIITTEVFTALKAKKYRGVIIKLDFAKAFDTVNWNFVFHVLQMMNFDERWISWIKAMYKASKISVLVNGAPTDEFASSRGLRQGDSLSPLMFNLVGEVLSRLLVSANKKGIFRGIKLPKCDIEFTHLQYADDVIMFINSDDVSIKGVKRVLQCFELLSGLHINFNKSSLYGFGDSEASLHKWASILGCEVGAVS